MRISTLRFGCLMLVLVLLPARSLAGKDELNNPFALVFIDKRTEDAMGQFPYDRSVLAATIRRCIELHAKGVVLKFILNTPRSENGDKELADAIGKTKVILQGGGNFSSPPNELPDRFKLALTVQGKPKAVNAGRGGNPLARFSERAYGLGFVDVSAMDRTPLIEAYGDKYVKALVTVCLELALDQTARIVPGESIRFGDRALALDDLSQAKIRYPAKDDATYISLIDFLGRLPVPSVKDRIVIVGFDADRFPPLDTPIGPLRPHRIFYYALRSIYSSLTTPKVPDPQ